MIDMTVPANRSYVTFITLALGLALEINCAPMKYARGVNLLQVATREGYEGPTRGAQAKRKALAWTVDIIRLNVPTWEPSDSVLRALAS